MNASSSSSIHVARATGATLWPLAQEFSELIDRRSLFRNQNLVDPFAVHIDNFNM
jgi:hypothetical protein